MILYFANREMQILGQASGALPCGFVILDDLKSEDVDTGVATFECKIGFSKENRLTLEAMTNSGNYLLRSHDNENEFYTIIDTEIDTKNQEVYIYAEDAGLDLLNEIVGAFEATESHPAEWYINKYTNDSGFEIGINEIPATSTRKLSWDGEATVTERLASIATQFGGYEISFSFDIKGMEVSNKYINIYKERGKELEEPLMLNRDIDRIITKKSVANLATAFLCTGGIPKGKDKPITLEGYEYDDGDFYVSGKYVKSREAVKKWSRYVWNKEPNQQTGYAGHIVRQYSYETTSQKTLCSHAITELKKICDMEVNYEIDIKKLPDTVRIGDRVNIVDDAGELYLSARILQLDTSIVNGSYKATLGEYLIKDSGISQKVEDLAAQFAELAANRTFYTWIAYADDETGAGISLDPAGKEYLGTAPNQVVEEVDISDPTVFSWSKIKGEQGPQGEQGEQGIQGPKGDKGDAGADGTDGKTSYFHIKYSSVSNPTSSSHMTETPSEYIGTYVDYTSTDSTDPSKYTWARFQGLQGETGEQGIPGTNGSDGKTSYLHIKYSNDGGNTFTSNNGETAGDYIGQYVDYTQADSTSVSAYTWSKIKGDTGRGTQNVTRYYILQSSTAAAPSKPTTNPPPSGWTDTEPTYTSGSTNSLYFCDLMVFSDKTWQYSEVSKSSSYEAAKEAYNKAVAADNAAQAAQDEANAISDKTRSGYIETLSGTGFVQSNKTEDGGTAEIVVYGKSVQDGTPTPDNPIEIQSVVNPVVKVCGKNLLNPTLSTTTENGIVFTNNGDGTYTLNGTATGTIDIIIGNVSVEPNKEYRLIGCPKGGTTTPNEGYKLYIMNNYTYPIDSGDGVNFIEISSTDQIRIQINNGVTCNNLVFKPMLTTDLNDTYDDFISHQEHSASLPYTLNAIPVSDGGNVTIDGQQYIADYVDVKRKKIVRRIGDVDLGTLNWGNITDGYGKIIFVSSLNDIRNYNNTETLIGFTTITNIFTNWNIINWTEAYGLSDKTVIASYNNILAIRDLNYENVDTFKQAMTGAKLLYELATPTETDLTDTDIESFKALETYYPITNVFVSDGITPDIDVSFWTRDHAAKEEAAAAAKVATNYIEGSEDGLIVGNMTAETLGRNVLIDVDSVDVRNADTVLASFGETTTVGETSGQHVLIDSDSLDIKNGDTVLATFSGDSLKCGENFSVDKTGALTANDAVITGNTTIIGNLITNGNVLICSENMKDDPYSGYIEFLTSSININGGQTLSLRATRGVDIGGALTVSDGISGDLTVTGQIISTGRHVLNNNTSVSFLNTSGTRVRGIGLGNTNNILIGADADIAGMYGYITAQNNIVFYAGTSHDQCFASIYDNGARYFQSKPIYDRTTSSGTAVRVNSNGTLYRYSSSSMRYKEEITCQLSEELNPERLYDLNVWQYKYREGHLDKGDQRYGKTHIGLLAEDVKQHYPIAANYNEDGYVEDWSERYLIPPMLKLIQMQHEEIELIKAELEKIRNAV